MRRPALFTSFMFIAGLFSLIPVNAQEDLIYVAVNPCRLVDTRNAGGAIAADSTRKFFVSGTVTGQGGSASGCQAPKQGLEPLAISAYVVSVPTSNSVSGVLTAYASDQPPPPPGAGATVNFAAGQVIGNTTNITLCHPATCPTDGEFAILTRNTTQHVVVDVQGYFYPLSTEPSTEPCHAGTATRFVDNGDGTICDNQTGLMWEKKDGKDEIADFDNPHDADNGYTWTSTTGGTAPDGTAFTDFLARLNGEVASTAATDQLGGYSDWRLPTSAELQTILFTPYPCSVIPCIDPVFGPTAESRYWSSTSYASNLIDAWRVSFFNGNVLYSQKISTFHVRAVRGGR